MLPLPGAMNLANTIECLKRSKIFIDLVFDSLTDRFLSGSKSYSGRQSMTLSVVER